MKILGVSDEILVCGCCGKNNLKKTVVLETEAGEILYYGCDCAAAALTGSKKNKGSVDALAFGISYVERNLKAGAAPATIARKLATTGKLGADYDRGKLKIWTDFGRREWAA